MRGYFTGDEFATTTAEVRDRQITHYRNGEPVHDECIGPVHVAAAGSALGVVTLREGARAECTGESAEQRARAEGETAGREIGSQATQ